MCVPCQAKLNTDPGEHDVTTSMGGRDDIPWNCRLVVGAQAVWEGVHKIKHTCFHSCFTQCCNWGQHFGQIVHRLDPMHGPVHVAQTLGQWWSVLFSVAAITNDHVFSGLK